MISSFSVFFIKCFILCYIFTGKRGKNGVQSRKLRGTVVRKNFDAYKQYLIFLLSDVIVGIEGLGAVVTVKEKKFSQIDISFE